MIEFQNLSARTGFSSSLPPFSGGRSVEPLELKIVPWSELKPHIDVFEADGKVRTGLFVRNNPINWMDPFGLVPRSTLGGDDPRFQNPQAAIRQLQLDLLNPNLTARERSQIRRRIQELSRRPSRAAQHHGRGLRRGAGLVGLLFSLAALQAQGDDCDPRIGELRSEIDRYLSARGDPSRTEEAQLAATGIGDLAGEIFGSSEAGGYLALELQ